MVAFVKRRSRFRMLGRAGVDVGQLLRSNGMAAMQYGIDVVGATERQLRKMRSAASACLTDGSSGKLLTLDLALRGAKLHPTCAANPGLLMQWARGIWVNLVPFGWLHRTLNDAKRVMNDKVYDKVWP